MKMEVENRGNQKEFGIWLRMTAWLTVRLDTCLLNVDNLHSDNLEFTFHPLSFCLLTVSSQSPICLANEMRSATYLFFPASCVLHFAAKPNSCLIWFNPLIQCSQSVSLSSLSPTVYDLLMRTYFRKSVSDSAGVWRKIESVPRAFSWEIVRKGPIFKKNN